MENEKIISLRKEVDEIDSEFIKLLNQRAMLSYQSNEIEDKKTICRLQAGNKGPLCDEAVSQLFTEIINQCKKI